MASGRQLLADIPPQRSVDGDVSKDQPWSSATWQLRSFEFSSPPPPIWRSQIGPIGLSDGPYEPDGPYLACARFRRAPCPCGPPHPLRPAIARDKLHGWAVGTSHRHPLPKPRSLRDRARVANHKATADGSMGTLLQAGCPRSSNRGITPLFENFNQFRIRRPDSSFGITHRQAKTRWPCSSLACFSQPTAMASCPTRYRETGGPGLTIRTRNIPSGARIVSAL